MGCEGGGGGRCVAAECLGVDWAGVVDEDGLGWAGVASVVRGRVIFIERDS